VSTCRSCGHENEPGARCCSQCATALAEPGFDRILYEERQREIDETYAAGYAKHPQEEWVGELGLAGLAAFDKAEGSEPL
jgi:predicted amidophosphoribosyltransferase